MAKPLSITSTAFEDGSTIPPQHTCSSDGTSPPLRWSRVPEETASLALIVDDPDAPRGTFTHWVLFNIPPGTEELVEGVDPAADLDGGTAAAVEGVNDFGNTGYGPPCPPPGHGTHHYHFRLYALDTAVDLDPGADRQQLLDAMEGHVLAEGDLVGTFSRSR